MDAARYRRDCVLILVEEPRDEIQNALYTTFQGNGWLNTASGHWHQHEPLTTYQLKHLINLQMCVINIF